MASENKKLAPIALTVLIILVVSFAYFALGNQNKGMNSKADSTIYKNLELKAAYTEEGDVKLFALANNNALSKYKSDQGDSIPEINTIVIGFEEAKMMKEENLFSKPGDKLTDFFGIDVIVGGLLEKTNTILDDFHFLSESGFKKLKGDDNTLFVKLNEEEMPKLFYTYPAERNTPLKFELAEGQISDYSKQTIAGETYYPLIIGSKEAKMMKEENLFSKPGDTIKELFGQKFVVVGIIKETNTGLDMMHLTPLRENELG